MSENRENRMTRDTKNEEKRQADERKEDARQAREQAALALLKGIGGLDAPLESGEEAAVQPKRKSQKGRWLVGATVVAAAAAVLLFARGGSEPQFELARSTDGVRAEAVETPLEGTASAESIGVFLTEEEIFAQELVPFAGEVVRVQNLRLTVGGSVMYRAVIDVKVTQSLSGGPDAGETVSLLLPNPLMEGVWVEDSDVTSALAPGAQAVFLATRYGEESCYEAGGESLCLMDLAQFGLMDGVRYTFAETAEGMRFAQEVYTGLSANCTIEEAWDYVCAGVEKARG